ncbi:MAG: glycosyltransferase, partial [Fischerella sp.]|nr:glycosyltransferase [Fischerella sp.]
MNREDEEAAKRYHLVPAERVRYIPGTGLNVARFNPNAILEAEVVGVRQELGIPIDAPLFLSVAEFIARKRPWDILKAFARLERTDAHLAFAGTGLLFDEMQQLASRLDIQDRVHFLGHRKDIPVLMLTSTATILASDQEGLPNCVMESLCMGTPAIGTEIRGTKDLLEGGCGILVKVGDVEGFTRAMSWV